MSKARRIRKNSVFTSGGKFPVFTLSYINTALSQSAFRIYKCYIIITHTSYIGITLGPVYMIPARRDGMLTEILLVIQILKSVYMIPPLIPPRRDLDNRYRDTA
jgi:hypothetical protein